MTARAMVLVSLLAAIWGARGEPPGSVSGGQITTGAVIHFGADPVPEYGKTSYGVQGLQYFASPGANQIPGLQQPAFVVYPGSVVSTNTLAQSTQNVQVGVEHAPPSYAYIVQPNPSTTASAAVPNHSYGVQSSSSSTGKVGAPQYIYAAHSSSTGDTGTPQYVYAAQSGSTSGDVGIPHYVYAAQPISSSTGESGPPYSYSVQSGSTAGDVGNKHYGYAAQLSASSTGESGIPHYSTQSTSSSEGEDAASHGFTALSSSSTTPSTTMETSGSHYKPSAAGGSLHQNVDITYDSLASTNNYPTFTTLAPPVSPPSLPKRTSPPPMKATTYGPPKSIIGPFLNTRHRYNTAILVPRHHQNPKLHFHHVPHLHLHSPKHFHSPGVLFKTRPHYSPASIKKPSLQLHHLNSVSHPDITKAIFRSKPVDSYAAAAQNHQQSTLSYYPTQSFAIVHRRSDQGDKQEGNELERDPDLQTTPVIVYKGVRPPVSVYQKPQPPPPIPMSPTHIMEQRKDFPESGNSLRPQSLGTVSSSSWMPINAPEGAVPARAYDIPAPDLSRGYDHFMGAIETDHPHAFHHSNKAGSVSTIPVYNYFLERPEDDEDHYGEVYKGDSEGVVSAVVLVKQR